MKWGLNRFLGITSKRSLPPFAHEPFDQWLKRRIPTDHNHEPVALLVDSSINYNYPRIAKAAVAVLEAAGFRVVLPEVGDEGRPLISKGFVSKARDAARDTIERLFPFAELGIPLVGIEPSSLLTLKDEYLYLMPGDPRVQSVADHALTFEEFLASLADNGRLDLNFTDKPAKVLLHGHCHQKALVGTGPSKRILSLPPNYQVDEVDSGCCGMAGAFGYEAEHYDISMKMGERRLFPAVRDADSQTIIAAAGVSCRQQIHHGTGRQALHPAEILRDALI
jgi:Fe-S oxidoreductase